MPATSKKKTAATGPAKPRTPKSIESSQQPLSSVSSSASPRDTTGSSAGALEKSAKLHKRSRSVSPRLGRERNAAVLDRSMLLTPGPCVVELGCFTCRLRRKKCDEKHPSCSACVNLNVSCEYKRPIWWGNPEQRRSQKERIKNKIKQTKMNERNGSITDPLARCSSMAVTSPVTPPEYEFNQPILTEPYDLFASSQMPVTDLGPVAYGPFGPYEIDVKTERQTYINDVPLRHDSSISTFSTFAPPQLDATLPTFPGEDWFQDEYFSQVPTLEGIDPVLCEPEVAPTYSLMPTNIPVSDHDRPLLDHFIHNVLRLIFPVLEAHEQAQPRAQTILHALETNKCYLHCCLSVAAIHLKTTEGLDGEQINHDIMRHRYEAVSQLCQALGEDVEHEEILDATLAMIFFHCSVGPADDHLPDIPWSDHFQAASNLVNRLGLPTEMLNCGGAYLTPSFNMTLASWIDILGSTMQGTTPQFAHTYRSKHLGGSSSGLRELMGCDDRVMYLISEIACLDALKNDGRIDSMAVCSHVSALGQQLEFTEPADHILENPYSPTTGAIRPEVLTKNMTSVFRTAARIYLCSLVPGFDRHQLSNVNLVSAVAHTLQYIPTGPNGFDRSLVWPLLIAGTFSTPNSEFRTVLAQRAASMGQHADLGSFGRMYRLLQEIWRQMDGSGCQSSIYLPDGQQQHVSRSVSPVTTKQERSDSPDSISAGLSQPVQVHWRDVMRQNNWHYLLI